MSLKWCMLFTVMSYLVAILEDICIFLNVSQNVISEARVHMHVVSLNVISEARVRIHAFVN
jgi:hypothetical protein